MTHDPSLLERGPALEQVRSALRRAADGAPVLVVVEGAAGIGKTALLHEVLRERGGVPRVLAARPAEHESGFAYGTLRQLLGPALVALDDATRTRLIDGPVGAALSRRPTEAPSPGLDTSFGVVDGLYWLVAELAARAPLVLVVDDAHWADAPTLRFLGHLVRRLDGLPVGIVLAVRPEEPGTPLHLLDPLRLDPRAETVRLRPLSAAAVGRLVARDGPGDPEFVRACGAASAGNPLYLLELLRTLDQGGEDRSGASVDRVAGASPASVARHVGHRVASLGASASALAEAMAVLGDGAPLARAAAVARVDPAHAAELAAALHGMEILASVDPVRFEHPIVRTALRSGIGPAAREALLRRVVAVLLREGAADEQIAGHLMELPPGGGLAVGPLLRAAEVALVRGAPDVAADYLGRALAEPPAPAERAGVLHALGTAQEMIGDDACWAHLREAIALVPDAPLRIGWTVELAVAEAFGGSIRQALTAVGSARAADDTPAPVREALGALLCALAWASADDEPEAEALLRGFERIPPGDPGAARLVLAAQASRMRGPWEDVAATAESAFGSGAEEEPGLGQLLATGSLVYADSFASAARHLDRALDAARATGSHSAIGPVHAMLAELAHATGDLAACESHARLHLGPLRGQSAAALAYSTATLVRALVDRGEPAQAQALLDELGDLPETRTSHVHYFLRAARGRLRCVQGRYAEGVADLAAARECLARFSGTTWSPIGFDGADAEPLALERLGRGEEARSLVAVSLRGARADGPPRNLAATLRTAAVLERGPGGSALAEEAVAVLEGTGARLELARTLVELGVLRSRAGRRGSAREALTRGHDLAVDCGARPLAERARDELQVAGARPRRDRLLSGPGALTPSELRLARLAASGRTNRELAQELYVAQKTVEMHLGRAYRKLGIHSRGDLAAALSNDDPGAG